MSAPRSLVLVTIDCLRADHVGFLGYQRPTTPFLDSLAGESFVFRNAIATGSPTYYSLPALLASRYPLALGRDLLGLAPGESTITTVLKECGFQTAAFVAANPYISTRFGYHQGFDLFRDFLDQGCEQFHFTLDESALSGTSIRGQVNQALSRACHAIAPLGAAYDELYFNYCQKAGARERDSLDSLRRFPSADVIVEDAIAWLNENVGRPFFLWLHLMDPHSPYYPKAQALEEIERGTIGAEQAKYLNAFWEREGVTGKRLLRKRNQVMALYDAGIRWADAQIRKLSEKLCELDLWDKCALAVTADHGEEFLEHGGRFHPPVKLTEELVRVPLLLRIPSVFGGRIIDPPLGLIDLAPTLLDVMRVPTPANFRGRSCWSRLQTNLGWDHAVLTECAYGCTNPFHARDRIAPRILAVRKGTHKLVVNFAHGTEQLFDLNSDPQENFPLHSDVKKAVRRDLLECARKHLAESSKSRDLDLRFDAQSQELRLEWAYSTAKLPN